MRQVIQSGYEQTLVVPGSPIIVNRTQYGWLTGQESLPNGCLVIFFHNIHLFERLLAKRLNAFAETNDLFPSLQFGFRKDLGTCDALLTITSAVQKSLDPLYDWS